MNPRELDILISLDAELPITDPDALALRARLRGSATTSSAANRPADAVAAVAASLAGDTATGTATDTGVDRVPAGSVAAGTPGF